MKEQINKPEREQQLKAFSRLLDIMDELREKCPWDKKQTLESLTRLTIEEVYEAVHAIENKDMKELEGELGDLFLHLVFYSKIGSEQDFFDVASVLNKVCDKLIYRHPHIYGDVVVENEEDVKRNWEQLKLKEGKTVLQGVPRSLPALLRAQRIQEKAAGVGFDFSKPEEILSKVEEEIKEFVNEQDIDKKQIEFGDILFSLVNLARFLGYDSEETLNLSNNKFIKRFNKVEQMVNVADGGFSKIKDKKKLEDYWECVKNNS